VIKYIFHTEGDEFGGMLSMATPASTSFADQLCYLYGGELACIHPEDADYDSMCKTQFPTLEAVQETYPNYTFVYFDPTATTYLDEFNHPEDNVVYVVGHDNYGFGDSDISNGTKIKLRTLHPEPFEAHAFSCLSSAIQDRWSKKWQ